MKFRFLVVLAFLFSGISYVHAQDAEEVSIMEETGIDVICGYKIADIKAMGIDFNYDSAQIISQISSGKFDTENPKFPGQDSVFDAKLMCILLHEITGLKDKQNAANVSKAIVDRYGPYYGKSVATCSSNLTTAIQGGDATVIIERFYDSTGRISTMTLPDFFTIICISNPKALPAELQKYDGSCDKIKKDITPKKARDLLAKQINKNVTTVTKVKKEKEKVDKGRISRELLSILQFDRDALNNLKKDITDPKKCATALADAQVLATEIETQINNKIIKRGNAGGSALSVSDEGVVTFLPEGKGFIKDEYSLDKDVAASEKAQIDALIVELNNLNAFIKKAKCGGSSIDLGDINGIPALAEGWFKNWNQCHMSLSSRPGLGALETCQQVILEGDYIDENAAAFGLKDKNGLVNYVKPGNIIEQINYYLGALVTTKNAKAVVEKAKPEENANLEADKKSVKTAEDYIVKMNKFLMEDFYTNDKVKNICFGFPVSTAASTTGKSNVTTKIKDLSVTASVDETIEFLTSSNVISVNAGRRSIQQLCVIFNRVKKANVGGYDDYKTFAGLIVDVLHLNSNIDVKAVFSGVEKTGKEAFEILLANAINDKNDKELIRVLSCLEGFGDIHELYQLGILTPDAYTMADAVTDTIIQSSVASDIMYKNVNIKSDNQTVDPINYTPVKKLFTPSNDDKKLPVVNNGTDNSTLPMVGSDVTSDVNKSISEFLVGVCNGRKGEEFKKSFEALLSLIPADIDLDKLKTAIMENVKTTLKDSPACKGLTEEDIIKAIKVAFFGVDLRVSILELDKIVADGIRVSDVSQAGKDILLAVDATKAYTSKELAVLAAGRFLYEYAVILKSEQKKSDVGNNGVYRSPNMKYDVQSKNINKKATVSSSNNAGSGKYRTSNTKYADAKTYNPNTSKHVKAGGTTSTTKTSANRSSTTKPNTAKTSTTKTNKTSKSSKFETKTVNRTK